MSSPTIRDVLSDNYSTLYRKWSKALDDRAALRGTLQGILERIRHPVVGDDTFDERDAERIERVLEETG